MTFIPRAVLNVQRGILTIPNSGPGSAPVSVVLTVLNSSYVRLRILKQVITGTSAGGEAATFAGLTVAPTTATSATITASRFDNSVGDAVTDIYYELSDLNPFFIRSIQRGNGSTVITGVDTTKCELDNLGATYTTNIGTYQAASLVAKLTDSTHVDQVGNGSGSAYWQVIEGH